MEMETNVAAASTDLFCCSFQDIWEIIDRCKTYRLLKWENSSSSSSISTVDKEQMIDGVLVLSPKHQNTSGCL